MVIADNGQSIEVTRLRTVRPLRSAMHATDEKTVPDALREALFGGPDTLKTYAILDAARMPNLPERLEGSGLEHRCLFTGESRESFGDVSPWVVRLVPDSAFTRALFTDEPTAPAKQYYWRSNPGIFLRSTGDLDQVWSHFRKFTRLRDASGAWMYFRFWEGVAWDGLVNTPPSEAAFLLRLLGEHRVIFRSTVSFESGRFFVVQSVGAETAMATSAVHQWN
jgi:hypothetical protein